MENLINLYISDLRINKKHFNRMLGIGMIFILFGYFMLYNTSILFFGTYVSTILCFCIDLHILHMHFFSTRPGDQNNTQDSSHGKEREKERICLMIYPSFR